MFILCLIAAGLSGCATLSWYGQAARGQLELITQREDIEKIIAAPETSPETRRKLELVLAARDFAHDELALPDNGSYSHFVDLQRDAVVWNVIAAPEFSLQPKTWCYPLVGCLAYRGYFNQETAERRAARLADEAWDTRVSPVSAYSTLGRFRDPVTSVMLAWSEQRLAGLIFHELTHQRLFVKGDTSFNESYASAVEHAGLQRFLQHHPRYGPMRPQSRHIERSFNQLLLEFRSRLEKLYHQDLPPDEMRRRKQEHFTELRRCYRQFRARHDDHRFDRFMQRELNNADLALVATYHLGTDAFLDLLAKYEGDFEHFHQAVEQLAEAGPARRAAFIAGNKATDESHTIEPPRAISRNRFDEQDQIDLACTSKQRAKPAEAGH